VTPEPRRLGAVDAESFLRDPARKQEYVTPMFDLVASSYDRFTRRFSFGMDARWKRHLLDDAAAAIPPRAGIVDVACGTGDLAFGLARRVPGATIRGIDASTQMIALARGRLALAGGAAARAMQFDVGDIMAMPCADASVDAVMGGYALRNAPDLRGALREIHRVLCPGGRLFVLDFFLPEGPVWRRLFLGYLSVAGQFVGWLWHREPAAYGYIARSIKHFVSSRLLCAMLAEEGFTVNRTRAWLRGGIAVIEAGRLP
jgi:demethylmenaquinone methyltransferase / 2-methoxy-6-polyprenyl-1,4-benzoquinol methylase